MENKFPSFGTFEAMNIQSAKCLSMLLLVVITATPSHAFHLPVRHSNSTNVNSTDSDDFHYRFREDTHSENGTQSYQYGRLSSNSTGNVYESPNDVHKEDYKNDTVHIVSPLGKHPNIPENVGNVKAKSEHKKMPGKMEAKIVDSNEEEAKELSQHGLLVDIPHNQKQESRPDKNPSIATYKNDIQKKEPDTSTKLLSLEQRIAAYLLQNKNQYLPNSSKDKKSDEKKEVIVSGLSTNMDNSEEEYGNTKVGHRLQNIDGANVKPQSRDNKLQKKNVQEIINTKLSPKYTLYDDIGKDDIGTDHMVKDGIGKGGTIKDEIRKDDGNNKATNDASINNGKDGHTKDDSKVYDYYYDSERRHVTESTRLHYDYDDKGYVTEDAADDNEDKHKSKDVLKGRSGETLLHETEVFHGKGSFHTVENFVEENSHSQKQQLARKKTKPGSKVSDDNNEEVAVSAFKARVTRGEDEYEDKRSVDMKHSPKMYQQSDNSSPPSKDKDHSDDIGDNKKPETGVESNTQFQIGDPLDPTGPTDNESPPKKDQFMEKPLTRGANTTLERQNVGTEHTSPEQNSNDMDKHEKDNTDREDEVKALTRSEPSNEASLPTDQKAWPGADNLEEVNSVLKYSTDNELPKIGDPKQTSSENTTQEILQPPGSDRNELDSSDLNKPDAQPKAYLAVWASTASKNTTHSNGSFNFETPSSTRPQTVKGKTESSIVDNKTMPQVNLWINKTNQDNKTADSQVMGNKTDVLLNVQNERTIERVNNNTVFSNEQMQNASKTSQDNINISNDANNNTDMNGHTLANSHGRARSDSTSSNKSGHIDRKMETDVNKLKVTPENVGLNNRTHTDSKMKVNVNKLKATPETVGLNNSRNIDSKMETDVNKLKATPETVGLNNSRHIDSKMETDVNKIKATPETVGLSNSRHIDSKMETDANKIKATPETVGLSNSRHIDSKMETDVNKLKAIPETVGLNNSRHIDSKKETDVNKIKATPETVGLSNSRHIDSKMETDVNKIKATPETVGLSNSRHIDSKMETDVNKLKATPQADSLKWVPSETVERATSSRKAISQINEYQKVPDQITPFDASVATVNNINNRKQNTQDILLETNRTRSATNVPDKSQLYKHNQPATQDLNQGSSDKVGISVNAKEANNSSIIEKGLSMNSNSSKKDTKIDDNRDDLNTATYGTARNLSDGVFTNTNISSLPLPESQAKLQSNSTPGMLKVSKTDNKLQNNNSVVINITAAQTSKFKVESFAATNNQSEARNIKQEQEIHIEKPAKLSTSTVRSTKSNVPSQKSTPANSNTLKNSQDDNSGNSSQVQGKAGTKTKHAGKQQDVIVSLQFSHKSNSTASGNQGSDVDTTNERKNNVSVNSSSRADGTPLDSNNRSYTDQQHSGHVYVVSHLANDSNSKGKIHVSNKTVGLNVPRKLLSISDLEVHENKSNKTIKTVHKIETNGGLTGKASNISRMSASKGNTTSDEIKTATVKADKGTRATESILKNGSEHLNGSRVNPAVKAKNVTEVNKVHQHTNFTNTSVKREAIPEPSRTELGINVNRTNQDKNNPQNISNVHKSKESDPVVTITFTVKKNSSNPRNEGLSKNATSNSFHEKAGLQPEVMANERHQQQKSQNQKLEPDIFTTGEIVDRDDMKMEAGTNKAGTGRRINNKEDDDKSKSSNNNGVSRNLSDGNDGEEEIGSQQLAVNERNDNEKGDNNKSRNRSHDSSDADKNSDIVRKNDESSDRTANEAVQQKQSVDESSAILDQEIGTGMNQKNSDLRGDKQLVNIDAKQIHNNNKASSDQKTTTIGKDISQDVDSAMSNDVKPREGDAESGFPQNEPDAKSDDVIDDIPKKGQTANSSGFGSSNSAAPSDKIPEISPYKVQDFSLLKPSTTKATANKDKTKTDQVKAKPPPAVPAAAASIPKNSSTDNSANASSNVRSECQDACNPDPGMSVPRGAQAAVSAVLTTHFGPTKDQMIPFDLELLDLADNYDNTTGMFICTIPGTYVISLYLMSHPGAKVNARVLINNRPIAALWADDAKNAGFYPSSSTQTIAQLAFGDQVYVMLVDGGYGDSWVHANYNVFTIFLLYEQMF